MDKQFRTLVDAIDRVDQELGKQKIFSYSTPDETNGHKLFVEIGGPSAHMKFNLLDREEHDIIKNAVIRVLNSRKAVLELQLVSLCSKAVQDNLHRIKEEHDA